MATKRKRAKSAPKKATGKKAAAKKKPAPRRAYKSPQAEKQQQDRWRSKKAAQRDRAREEGRCIVCLQNPADPDHVTCAECRERIAKYRQARRERER